MFPAIQFTRTLATPIVKAKFSNYLRKIANALRKENMWHTSQQHRTYLNLSCNEFHQI